MVKTLVPRFCNRSFDEYNRFEGSFAMLTDINDRKEMEMLLEDLSNKDGLTGLLIEESLMKP